MIRRSLKLSKTNSFLLFGPRGVGKSTLIREHMAQTFGNRKILWIDLLKDEDEERFARYPDELSHTLDSHKQDSFAAVVIDEIQRAPKLLDIVHLEMERRKIPFFMTGSSARKLKRGAANLLAGRAFSYVLHPLSSAELGERFDLDHALQWGTLPLAVNLTDPEDRAQFLRSYVKTYLKEEIVAEQLVRNLNPFRDFLEIAAQCNSQPINHSKIARDIGVDDKTVHSYYTILEDTLVGVLLKPFHRSLRKQQRQASKFYFFDLGVKRALEHSLKVPLQEGTFAFGRAFEHFLILEVHRINDDFQKDYRFSYLLTKSDAEIDLIVERPGQPDLLVEIKSTARIEPQDTTPLQSFAKDWHRPVEAQLWSRDPVSKKFGAVDCLHWAEALQGLR